MSEAVERRPSVRSLGWVIRRPRSRWGAPPFIEEQLPKPGTEMGGSRLEARLGAGSFGTVFRARRGDSLYGPAESRDHRELSDPKGTNQDQLPIRGWPSSRGFP